MTYYELNEYIKTECQKYYGTGYTITFTMGDIKQYNGKKDNIYPAFHLYLNRNTLLTADTKYSVANENYQFYLFYIDQLNRDESNMITIQSDGMEILKTIINSIAESTTVSISYPIPITPFDSKAAQIDDICSGAYADITIKSLSECDTN